MLILFKGYFMFIKRTSLSLVLLVALTACGEKADTTTQTADQTATTTQDNGNSVTVDTADSTEKLNAYIDCTNATLNDLHRRYNHYTRWLSDAKTGPTGKESSILGFEKYSDQEIKACDTAMTMVSSQPSLGTLDTAMSDYITAFKAHADVAKKASTYYEQGNYKDDAFAEGKALHQELVSTYEAAAAAGDKVNAELDTVNSKAQAEQLTQIEQTEGKNLRYWQLSNAIKAKNLADLTAKEDFDIAQAETLFKDYEASMNETVKILDAGGHKPNEFHPLLKERLNDFLIANKERIRRVRDKTPYSDHDIRLLNMGSTPATQVVGSEPAVVYTYNQLISVLRT